MRFWFSVESEFPQISTKAMKVLIPFTSTYLCECGFSALTLIKNKYRSRLQAEDDLRLFLSDQFNIKHNFIQYIIRGSPLHLSISSGVLGLENIEDLFSSRPRGSFNSERLTSSFLLFASKGLA